MITEHDLQEAIAECEGQRNPSANTCLKLAAFYTIRDKMYPDKQEEVEIHPQYSYARSAADIKPETEFKQVARMTDQETLLNIMDELMITVKAIIPNLYDGVMRKLTEY